MIMMYDKELEVDNNHVYGLNGEYLFNYVERDNKDYIVTEFPPGYYWMQESPNFEALKHLNGFLTEA